MAMCNKRFKNTMISKVDQKAPKNFTIGIEVVIVITTMVRIDTSINEMLIIPILAVLVFI